ncbi:sensor protein KdpD [Variibacter gotjawalensis]|uniref:histidine kinase n=1 Tax=Variibacter gotjawalensis TaxID=1333996 RepID=A0A0S3PRL6_9BRAD|nr:sensor histidine kinase KdpD [Variibacter gotjawalensis]NIK48768.1 two-component system sensor histidine kinase KdpD [Variibacter gotjawalensis]RZS50629.1 two-component system sensor histidine kinase KdpD [Variibacter gotjawalensis]BAT58462.1 sensor protein KdpD [Variibacter gotjawalensis]
MTTDLDRPQPEALLDAERGAGRGKLKVFLGASPGVGKTFAMLEEARARQRAGVDVVVALVETHGRAETANLLSTLEQLPRKVIDYRNQSLPELDLDALLARKPGLALIDEFAHTNVPGARHPKRWQDVLEVLDAGIDVVTTLNVQHIESLNDVVARITGVRVQETVPDAVLQQADTIELIDLPPEELLNRLREGKVYVPQQIGRALDNFFSKGNLTALRELALRTAASRVDADMLTYMQANAVRGPWPTEDRLLVCVNESPNANALVRAGKRMAERAKIPWIVATVVTPRHEALGAAARDVVIEAMRLAETLGAETETLHAESDAVGELLTFARARNVTRLVVGRPRRRWPFGYLREAVSDSLIDRAGDFEVTVLGHTAVRPRPTQIAIETPAWRDWGLIGGETILAMAAATAIAWPFWQYVPVASIAVVYLLAVSAIAFRHGLVAALAASGIGFLTYNFFFTTPYYSFSVEQYESIVALLVFLISALFTGTLASRLKAQVDSMRSAQRRTETLYDFARKIATATKADDVLWAGAVHIATALNCRSLILMPNAVGALEQVQGHPSIEDLDARAEGAARWAYEKNETTGAGTTTLPTSEWLFVPLATTRAVLGVIGVQFLDSKKLDPERKRLLFAVEDQVTVALERFTLIADVENARVRAESEKLRAALLNSVSHDLRTPLVSVIGAMTGLSGNLDKLKPAEQEELIGMALDEARRLDRYVQNLLDMTRLGHGALAPRLTPIDLREVVGRVRADLARVTAEHSILINMPRDLPQVAADPVLLGQAIANVLENAAKYAPIGSEIAIVATVQGGFVNLAISDEGPGIAEADREKVFDLFYRAAKGDGAPAGTGLGLSIVKGLIEAHGGSVHIETGPSGRGTSVVMRLPVAPSRPADETDG